MAWATTLKTKSPQGSPGLVPARATATPSSPGTVNHVEACISCTRARLNGGRAKACTAAGRRSRSRTARWAGGERPSRASSQANASS
eukprot:656925-Lingulodinium_polyedra.AAC.1